MPVITIIAFSNSVFHITLIRIACFCGQLSHRSKIGVSHNSSVEISCLQQKSGFCTISWFVNAVCVFQICRPPLHTDMEMGTIYISQSSEFMSLNPSLGDGVCMHTGKPSYSHPCSIPVPDHCILLSQVPAMFIHYPRKMWPLWLALLLFYYLYIIKMLSLLLPPDYFCW